MEYAILEGNHPYTGRELRSGWVHEKSGLAGEVAVGFLGPCRVANEDLVDLEDARAGTFIEAASMAHVLVELPERSLAEGVLAQRLLVCLLREILSARALAVERDGDDLYVGGRKLTVSIAAPSRRSVLIHLGINVDPSGAPVPAVGLAELGVGAEELLEELLERYRREMESCRKATGKVREVP